jgi:hypothetical protein
MKYIIKDWMGNICFNGVEFDSFLEGWDYIYVNDPMPEESHPDYNSWYDDYFVEEKEGKE